MESQKPFPDAVLELLAERNMSQRELARRAQDKTGGYPHYTHLNSRVLGDAPPNLRMMEAVASAFNISPHYFAEYRLEMIRNSLDPERVGVEAALRNLSRLQG